MVEQECIAVKGDTSAAQRALINWAVNFPPAGKWNINRGNGSFPRRAIRERGKTGSEKVLEKEEAP